MPKKPKKEDLFALTTTPRSRALCRMAAEKWASAISRVYSGVRGCGYDVPQMLDDRDALRGGNDSAGLVALFAEQTTALDIEGLREGDVVYLAPHARRALWYGLRKYRENVEKLRKDEVDAGRPVKAHDEDLRIIGEWDDEDRRPEGGLLAELWDGYEGRPDDPGQQELS